ncbi:hypothetical protein AVEN_246008-1 [Araneus ventricosus]|uniref:Uncharacterized protein n=1 Tax=Araneus ventricosus TaxID=182803 RepID=A0A4Y2FFV2_ARAVE|nr:hypothetical protein AVEN_246008-1 [Araneus ventricosus]
MPPYIIGRGGLPKLMLVFDAFTLINKLFKPLGDTHVQSLQGHGVISIHLLQHCKTLACLPDDLPNLYKNFKLISCSMTSPQNHRTDNNR